MKKIISFLLSVLIVVSCCVVPTFAAEEGAKLSITEEQFGILRTTEAAIESSVSAIPDGTIPRGVAARRFAKFGNFRYSTAREYEALFYDLSTDNYYYYYIKGCYDNGVMQGYPDGTFRPDNPISTLETAKVLLYTMGYKDYINAVGIQRVMQMTGLMDGISEVSDAITYSDFYRMMYNAYQAPYCLATEFSSNGDVNCKINDDYTVLQHLWGMKRGSGVVDGATATLLERPDETMLDNMISIDEERFILGVENSTDYLGYNVDFYYKVNQDNKTNGNEIVYIYKNDKNKVLELQNTDLEDYVDFELKYVKNNRFETIELTETTDVIYNGVACPNFTKAELMPSFGKITLVDNDKKKTGYEVVLVENHEFYLVDTIDAGKLRVIDQNPDIPVLDMENADLVTIKWDGEEFPADRIVKGNLLKVQRTKPDCGYYVCDVQVFKNEKNNVTVLNATEEYVSEATFQHPIWNGIDDASRDLLKAGNIVTLYMYEGTVVRVATEQADTAKIGYIMNVVADGIFEKAVSLRIMNNSATATTYNINKVVRIDETPFNDSKKILTYLANTAKESVVYSELAPYAQPIKFKTNADGLITYIDTMYTDAEKENTETCLTLSYSISEEDAAKGIGGKYRAFAVEALYDSSHMATIKNITLKVPVNGADRLDEKNYATGASDSLCYPMEIFNLKEPIRIAEYGIMYTPSAGASSAVVYSNNHDPAIIYAKNAVLNEDGEVDYSLETYFRKTTKTFKYRAEDLEKFEALALCDVGDVVQVHEDKYGYLDGIKMVYDVSEFIPEDQRHFQWGAGGSAVPVNGGYKAVYTTVVDREDGYIRTTTSHPEDDAGLNPDYQGDTFAPSASPIFKYTDIRGEVTVEEATLADIVTYKQNSKEFTPVIFIYNHNTGGLNNIYIISK